MPPVLTFPLAFTRGQSPVRKQANVRLELRTRSGSWEPALFRVDTGRFPDLPEVVFRWECLFDPTVPPAAPCLLGIGGRVLTDVHITFRGASREQVDGSVAFEVLAPPAPA